jgi:hypothetical protein
VRVALLDGGQDAGAVVLPAWPQVLDFFGTPLLIDLSPYFEGFE